MGRTVIYNVEQMNEDEKRSFLKELKDGSHQAYRRLYDLYGKEILGYIRTYFLFDRFTAEDVLQEAFITAYVKISSLKDVNKVRAWLYKIASRKCIDFKRKRKSEDKYMKEYWEQSTVSAKKSIEDKVIEKELFRTLNNEVHRLPDFPREVFILRGYQSLQYQEIVEITETSMSRVKKAMKKAVSRLLKQLKKRGITKDIIEQL